MAHGTLYLEGIGEMKVNEPGRQKRKGRTPSGSKEPLKICVFSASAVSQHVGREGGILRRTRLRRVQVRREIALLGKKRLQRVQVSRETALLGRKCLQPVQVSGKRRYRAESVASVYSTTGQKAYRMRTSE